MKKGLLLLLSTLFIATSTIQIAFSQSFNYLGTYNSIGRPGYLAPSDTLSAEFSKRIALSLPAAYAVPQYHPEYLLTSNTTDVRLQDTSEIWITFVDEGAGYKNTLAFYTYDITAPAKTINKPSKLTVIFPNISYENNVLKKGDKVRLGRFPKNTGIGFALIADGFSSGSVSAGGKNIFYSNPDFNPEKDPTKRQHSVLLRDPSGRLIIGFEDLMRTSSSADNDFNDAIFYITANPSTAFIGTLPITVGATPTPSISSANDGGLESNGSLAESIALRNFQRAKTPSVSYDNPENLEVFRMPKKVGVQVRGDNELSQFIPESPFFEPATARISSPVDLVNITNAESVLSVDYFDDATQERLAAVLTTKTATKVYEHTKVICDRLIGSQLLYTENIMIDEMPMIRSVLQREDGTFEYNISFAVAKENSTTASVLSRWSVDEYPSKSEYWNFQVWAEAPHLSQKVVEEIFAKFKEVYPNFNANTTTQIPQVYIKKGSYDNGILTLTINNLVDARVLTLNGNYTSAETGSRTEYSKQISLTGETEETVKIFVGSIFDMGFTVRNDKSTGFDALYFADGAWGLEYNKNISKIDEYTVNSGIPAVADDKYTLERDPILRGHVKDYVSLFRSLRPANAVANMIGFKNLSFEGSGSGIVEVTLVKKSVSDWSKQYRSEVRLFNEKQEYTLALKDFTNGTNEPLKADDLVNVVFTVKGDGQNLKPFEMSFSNVVFDNKEIKTIGAAGSLTAFPNPAVEKTELGFDLTERSTAIIIVSNAQGQSVIEHKEEFAKGRNRYLLELNHLPAGMYIASVITAKGKMTTKVIIP